MELIDGRTRLRKPTPNDGPALSEAVRRSYRHLTPWMPWAKPDHSPEDALFWIEGHHNPDEDHYILVDLDDRPIGTAGLKLFNAHDRGEIGYWVDVGATRRGHATTATRLLLGHGFEHHRLHRIEIVMSVENEASRRVAEKVGAHHEGVLRARLLLGDRHHDAHLHSVLATDRR